MSKHQLSNLRKTVKEIFKSESGCSVLLKATALSNGIVKKLLFDKIIALILADIDKLAKTTHSMFSVSLLAHETMNLLRLYWREYKLDTNLSR